MKTKYLRIKDFLFKRSNSAGQPAGQDRGLNHRFIVYQRVPEDELIIRIASMTQVQVDAIYQLISDLQNEAVEGATFSVANHGICASSVGGAEHLRILKDRIAACREKSPGASVPEVPAPHSKIPARG